MVPFLSRLVPMYRGPPASAQCYFPLYLNHYCTNVHSRGARGMGWGKAFFGNGWKGQPWVVIDRRPSVRTEEDFRAVLRQAKETENWVFGLWEDSVLHAPTFGVVASEEVQRRIASALEAYPARRVIEFEQFERAAYEKAGWPPEVIEHVTPRADAQLTPAQFQAPILTTFNDGRDLLGNVSTSDIVFGALTRCPVPVDRAGALRILLTAHGHPGEKFQETPFSAPFHPAEFKNLVRRLRGRCPEDPAGELLRVLADQVPHVVESLRRRPPRALRAHSVGRRRLATAGSNALWPTRRRRVHDNPREDPDEKLRTELKQLTPAQRVLLVAHLESAPIQQALVHVVEEGGWSLAWWKGRKTGRRTSTLGRTRQEVLKKIRAVKREA